MSFLKFWLQSDEDESHKAMRVISDINSYGTRLAAERENVGHKLPILVVKSK